MRLYSLFAMILAVLVLTLSGCDTQTDPSTDSGVDAGVDCIDDSDCHDDDVCNGEETCQAGQCLDSEPLDCDDNDECTDDSCSASVGCEHFNNQNTCEDGDPCTVEDHCVGGSCQPGNVTLDCDDNEDCTDDECLAGTGCVNTPDDTNSCADGQECSSNDRCYQGVCIGDFDQDCDDQNPCTLDLCDDTLGCVHTFNQEPCDDNNACTTDDVCDGGICLGGSLLDCDDNSWQDRYPIKQAKRLVDVRHWPKDELRKYIPSSKSIGRLHQGARWVRWVRPARSVTSGTLYGAEEGARVVDGGTALELYRNDDYPCCRVYYIRWGDDDPRHYCREWKNR